MNLFTEQKETHGQHTYGYQWGLVGGGRDEGFGFGIGTLCMWKD